MKQIPTAEEFLDLQHKTVPSTKFDIRQVMIEFAKLHIEAALKASYDNAEIENCGNPYDSEDDSKCVNKNSILNSYPLENIK